MTEKRQAVCIALLNIVLAAIVAVLIYMAIHPNKVQAAASQRFSIEHIQAEPSTEIQVIHDTQGACHGVWVHYVGGAQVAVVPLGSIVCN